VTRKKKGKAKKDAVPEKKMRSFSFDFDDGEVHLVSYWALFADR
jgi:hypothetical protein